MLAQHGITPATLAREAVTFVDVVSRGGTFEELFSLLDNWIVDFREPWDVIRRQPLPGTPTTRARTGASGPGQRSPRPSLSCGTGEVGRDVGRWHGPPRGNRR